MIICTACGVRNQDGESFCGECGAYLEWEGEREAPAPGAPAPAREAAPNPPSAAPGLVQWIKSAVGSAPAPPPPTGYPPPSPGYAPPPPPGHAPRPPGPAQAADPARSPESAAPSLAVDSAPAPVLPGAAAPKPQRRGLPPEDRGPAPGEIICGDCGAGNAPTRKFCRRCGTDLADAPIVRRAPWWRRVFQPRQRRGTVAGTRPARKVRRSHRRLIVTAAVMLLLVAGGWLARAPLSRTYNSVLDRVEGTKIVNPTSLSASGSAPGHEAAMARDGKTNRYWAPAPRANPKGQWVEMRFASAYRLVYLRVFNGASSQLDEYLKEGHPGKLRLTIMRKGGKKSTKDIELNDKAGSQSVHLGFDDVVGVRLTIQTVVYPPKSGNLVAIGEVEFLARA